MTGAHGMARNLGGFAGDSLPGKSIGLAQRVSKRKGFRGIGTGTWYPLRERKAPSERLGGLRVTREG